MDHSNPTFAKILIFDTGKFEQWKFKIQQYLQNEHYALWEVIEFGDSYKAPPEETGKGPISESSARKKGRTVAITTKDMQKRSNNVKARTTLLLALPDEHQLRFSKYETSKELWKAILKTFSGNEATKKTKKNQLKLQYGNFKAKGSETLKQTFNILQAISGSNSQNMAFFSSSNTTSGKGKVHTASVPTASIQVSTASADVAAASLSHDTICAYIATQSNGSQIKYEDITQIDEDDIEEMDIKWNMALLSMEADRFWKKITIQGYDVAGFDKSKVECFNCHKMGHFARECRAPRSQDRGKRESYKQGPKEENHALVADDEVPTEFALMAKSSSSSDNEVYDDSFCSKSRRKNTKNLTTKINKLNEELSDCETDLYNYKRGLSQVEARLVEFKENKVKFCERIRVLERDVEIRDNKIEYLKNELEQEGLGYSAVSPPHAQIYSPPKKDLSWTCLPEFVDDTVTDYRRPTPSIDASKCNKSPKVRGNQRNWNNLKSQQLGKDFLMQNKACFKCGYFDHLASNYGVWVDNGETWPTDNYTHKSMTPRAVLLKPGTTPIVETRERLLRPQLIGFGDLNKILLNKVNLQNNINDKGYWDSGCSRHMTRNISYLSEYEPYDGGYVSFGHGGRKITGKGIIKTVVNRSVPMVSVLLFQDEDRCNTDLNNQL
uniref:CCHC-type domain-containing protein n=1 Tax=Tanacetum cinerariifolium TaxID=118510 RepID=A0A699H376_TANCI|nr:hypothetical protein [Tanacetum cinerariifolium]